MSAAALFEAYGATRLFGGVRAVDGVDLSARRGSVHGLIGPNGAGKTTLLNLIAGFLEPDAGELFIDGERVTDTPPHRRSIGMVFQNYALFPHLTVQGNVAFPLEMRNVARSSMRPTSLMSGTLEQPTPWSTQRTT